MKPNYLDNIESPYMDQHRALIERQAAGERAIRQLLVWRIVAVMGWLAFGAVVIVAGMR